jgi:hypothetical protein
MGIVYTHALCIKKFNLSSANYTLKNQEQTRKSEAEGSGIDYPYTIGGLGSYE